jgi:L-ascorbate metabolism protein UlaG (beta-lactamase superfamily)
MNSTDGAPLALTWHGHATTLIELDGVRLLTDPVMRGRIGPLVRVAPAVAADAGEGIDAVLLSHLHADHADATSLRAVGRETLVIAPPGAGAWLRGAGLANVIELGAGEVTRVGAVSVTASPAAHEGRRWRYGTRAQSIGFIAAGSLSCYFAGDTDLFDAMSEIGPLDAALLPVSGWGPTLGAGHLDPERAATAAERISPRVAVPIHWGTLGLPLARLRPSQPAAPAREFASLVAERSPGVEVRILSPGERTEIAAVRAGGARAAGGT